MAVEAVDLAAEVDGTTSMTTGVAEGLLRSGVPEGVSTGVGAGTAPSTTGTDLLDPGWTKMDLRVEDSEAEMTAGDHLTTMRTDPLTGRNNILIKQQLVLLHLK